MPSCRVVAACLLLSTAAFAQSKGQVFTLRHVRNNAAEGARAKALAGDCKGALDLFDEALRHSEDPELYRDRGKCHDKLGDVYPAIDDYRAYLARAPDASDANTYRQRVIDLTGKASQDMAPGLGSGGTYDSEMQGGMTDGSTPTVVHVTGSSEPQKTQEQHDEEEGKSINEIEQSETRESQAKKSATRLGTGFVIGAFYYPRYVFGDPYAFQVGQGIGARIGWAFASSSTLFVEVGYMNQLSGGSLQEKDGLMTLLAYEARIPFDHLGSNQLVLAAGGGYENLTLESLGQTYACIVGRGRAGYRHVFGPSFALDIAADGGLMAIFPINPPAGTSAPAVSVAGLFGGIVQLSVGF